MYLILGSFHFHLASNFSGRKYINWVNYRLGPMSLATSAVRWNAVHMLQEVNEIPFYMASLRTVKIHANMMDETSVKAFPNIPTGQQTQTQWSSVSLRRSEKPIGQSGRVGSLNPAQAHCFQNLSCKGRTLQHLWQSSQHPQPQGRARTPSWVSPCYPARLTLKPPGKVTHEWESCQAVISQSKRKSKCHSLDICSYNAVHLPRSNFLFCPLISALFVTHLTPIWEYFKSDWPSGSITWYFPGCWFWAQAGVFVVTPSHLNAALATAHQVLQKGYIHMTLIHSFGKAEQALSPGADTVSHYDLEGSFSEIQHRDDKSVNSFGICFFVNSQTWLITLM